MRSIGKALAFSLLGCALVGCGEDRSPSQAAGQASRDDVPQQPVMRLLPDNLLFVAGDPRLSTEVGKRDGRRAIESTGKAGALVFGPYFAVKRGRYDVTWFGWVRGPRGLDGVRFDVAVQLGHAVVAIGTLLSDPKGSDSSPVALGHASIDLAAEVEDLETRMFVSSESKVAFSHVEIREVLK